MDSNGADVVIVAGRLALGMNYSTDGIQIGDAITKKYEVNYGRK